MFDKRNHSVRQVYTSSKLKQTNAIDKSRLLGRFLSAVPLAIRFLRSLWWWWWWYEFDAVDSRFVEPRATRVQTASKWPEWYKSNCVAPKCDHRLEQSIKTKHERAGDNWPTCVLIIRFLTNSQCYKPNSTHAHTRIYLHFSPIVMDLNSCNIAAKSINPTQWNVSLWYRANSWS